LIYTNLSVSANTPLCSNLIFLYIIGYNNISWRPHDPYDPPFHKLGVVTPRPQHPSIDAYANEDE